MSRSDTAGAAGATSVTGSTGSADSALRRRSCAAPQAVRGRAVPTGHPGSRAPQQPGHLLLGQDLVVPQHHRGSLPGRQQRQHALQAGPFVHRGGLVAHPGRVGHRVHRLFASPAPPRGTCHRTDQHAPHLRLP
ncbi:hypothetical protein [Streptomyces griseorubiginosus]|uniref:hypothetical protein n=1 Tax=Streptomyces griseorubiginosus TaxID=67304 RepID=UPI003664EBA2